MNHQRRALLRPVTALLLAVVLACGVTGVVSAGTQPNYDHIVVVIMENHSFAQIYQAPTAPYLQRLLRTGAIFDNSHGVAHPSQPNYLALFSGSTHEVRDDGVHYVDGSNLARRLRAARKTFTGYVEVGSPRKHNPWESFVDARGAEKSLAAFPHDYANLPAVSFVIPNLRNDMHDGTIGQADAWLKAHLGAYANWSRSHNSLLIVTFDEDDYGIDNRIFTLLYGAHIKTGRYVERIDHYTVLRTIEDIEGISPLGATVVRNAIGSAWSRE